MYPFKLARLFLVLAGLALLPGPLFLSAAFADTTIKLPTHLTITVPDWLSWAALAHGGVQQSPDNRFRSIASGQLFHGEADGDGGSAYITVKSATSLIKDDLPNPTSNAFPLEEFGASLERRALRDIDDGKVERISLSKTTLENGDVVIEHQFRVTGEKPLNRYYYFIFNAKTKAVLDIQYPVAMEGKWRDAIKAIILSFHSIE